MNDTLKVTFNIKFERTETRDLDEQYDAWWVAVLPFVKSYAAANGLQYISSRAGFRIVEAKTPKPRAKRGAP